MQLVISKEQIIGLTRKKSIRYISIDKRFEDSGSARNLGVDGTTPVDYFLGPAAGEVWACSYLSLLLVDPGTMTEGVFGGLVSGLTNGLELLSDINGAERRHTNLKDNADLLQCFSGGISGMSTIPGNTGFLNTEDFTAGRMSLDDMILIGDNGDKLIARVRDNLSLVQFLGITLHAYLFI